MRISARVLTLLVFSAALNVNAKQLDRLEMVCFESEEQLRVGADKANRLFVLTQDLEQEVSGSQLLENLYPLDGEELISSATLKVYEGIGSDVKNGRLKVEDLKDEALVDTHKGKLTTSLGQLVISKGTKKDSSGFAMSVSLDEGTSRGVARVGKYREFGVFKNPYWDINCNKPKIIPAPVQEDTQGSYEYTEGPNGFLDDSEV